MVEEFPLTWLERRLQPLAIRFLKKWVGLAQPSNTAILFLRGRLALPSLVSLYKKQQSSRMVQLFTSDDPGVRRAAHLLLQEEERAQRTRFKLAVFVNEVRAVDPSNRPSRYDLFYEFVNKLPAIIALENAG